MTGVFEAIATGAFAAGVLTLILALRRRRLRSLWSLFGAPNALERVQRLERSHEKAYKSAGTSTGLATPPMPGRWATRYVYWVCFRDLETDVSDEDHEWSAVFVVEAETAELAHTWGNELTREFVSLGGNEVLWSRIEEYHGDLAKEHWMPVIAYGERASREKIGW